MRHKELAKLDKEYIGLLGLGLENQSFLRLADRKKIKAKLAICDKREEKEIKEILSQAKLSKRIIDSLEIQAGKGYKENLDRFDRLLRSPGWPLWCDSLDAPREAKTIIDSPMNLFCRLCPTKHLIAVSGSKGKGTTASLIAKIIKSSGQKVFLGGNIGIAPLDFLDKLTPPSWVVLELSSFQLEDLNFRPQVAVITNLFKEHLAPADPNNPNYHPSFASYWRAKLQLSKNQGRKDFLIANQKLRGKLGKGNIESRITYFSRSQSRSRLAGDFNQENIAAAEAVARAIGIKEDIYKGAVASFANLEHRLEKVLEKDGVTYYDNSFSTTPESTRLDLLSFDSPIIAIMGGADKGANFSSLAKTAKKKAKAIIMLPGAGSKRLREALAKEGYRKIKPVSSMEQAVKEARGLAKEGDIILLSTACASFGIFKNYKERGDKFQYYAKKIS